MTVVVYEVNENNDFEEIGRAYDDGQIDETLLGIYPKGVWQEESDEWLVERLDGPYVVGEILDEGEDVDKVEKVWMEYVGPEGGEGWQNLMTGEVRYQDHEPTDDGHDHGQDVQEPEDDSEFTEFGGISDASFIRDNMPVTVKFTDEGGTEHYGEVEEADVGGYRSEFVVAAANGHRYHVEEDNVEGFIEPEPEWNPESDEEDRMWQNQFEEVKQELNENTIPPIPSRNMGNGGDVPDTSEFNHIGSGKVTEEHVQVLQETIESGDLGPLSVDFLAAGDGVDYGPWDTDITDWHDGGQFAHVDVEMTPEDFLATQATMLADDRDHPVEAHRSFFGSARADDVKEYAQTLNEEPGEMPMPFIEIGQHGRLRDYQEGRHRALAASHAGHETMPVRMVVNAEREGKHAEDRVEWPSSDEKSVSKAWIPYQGPQGGEGWQNTQNPEDVRYQDEPPGEIEPGYEEQAENWGSSSEEQRVDLPDQFEDDYDPEDVTPMEDLGDPSEWDGQFPFSEGQTLLGTMWEWEVDNLWFESSDVHVDEPHMELQIGPGATHEVGYVTDSVKLNGLEPGWYKNPEVPSKNNRREFIGVVGEPEPQSTGFEPSESVAENADFDLSEAADNMVQSVKEEKFDNEAAKEYTADLIEETNADYQTLIELAEHGIEASGGEVDHSRDITDAEEIVLNGVKRYLHRQAEDHPVLDGKLSLGHVSEELHEDFQSRMSTDTRSEISNIMQSWVSGLSMVEEETLPLYALADETFDNDFYPTRDDVDPIFEEAENLEERKEMVDRYRQKTIEVFREQWGDTIPVFRGYDPGPQSEAERARSALQSEDPPDTIEMRNGVANSWSTDPTVAYQFSQWGTASSGIVVRQELPVERIFGAADTAPDLMGKETEVIAGNADEYMEHSREDVFLPEDFDALEQAKWALEQAQGETGDEEEKSEGETLRLDWELSTVGWMNEHAALEDVLLDKNWIPVEADSANYQHIESGEMVATKAFGFSKTAANAGYRPRRFAIGGDIEKEWVPYTGPRGGQGWRNTTTENVRYQEEKPHEEPVDPSELTEEEVEDATIHQTWGFAETTANTLREGDLLNYHDGEFEWELRVQDVTEEGIEAIDTETRREITIPTNEYGEPEDDDATLRKPQAVFFGHGISGAESSWLPEDPDDITDTHLEAEALRSAASTDGFGDTSYIEAFAARTDKLGIDRQRATDAIESALEEHPVLQPDQAEEIYENGQRLLEIEEGLQEGKLMKASKLVEPVAYLRKEWIPYEGPQGGEGWQNINNPSDIRYQDKPPGEIADGYEEMAEGWGGYDPDEEDRIQGATVVEYPVSGSDTDLRIPGNFKTEDLAAVSNDMPLGGEVAGKTWTLKEKVTSIIFENDWDTEDKTDVLRATAEALEDHPEKVEEFNDKLHERVKVPDPDFDAPFGMEGPEVHDLLEETFGRFSDIVSDLEDSILFDEDTDEEDAETWIVGAQEWIRHNGDRRMAEEFEEALNDQAMENPFLNVQDADVPDHMDPAKSENVTPISETNAETGISASSMFIAEYEDGSRAFITNTNWERADPDRGIGEESEVSAQRAMAGYHAFQAADMEVPRHEHVEDEYWTVEEAEGVPAKNWDGNPEDLDREQFYKLGAIAMLSGNWDLHASNVFVSDDNELIPVDLDLSGHMMVDDYRRNTSWGRLKGLGDKLGLFDRTDSSDVDEMKYEIARKTQELVENGTADDIKSMASQIDNMDIQMNIEENVFAAKDGELYDESTRQPPEPTEGDGGEDPDIEEMVGNLMDNLGEDSE